MSLRPSKTGPSGKVTSFWRCFAGQRIIGTICLGQSRCAPGSWQPGWNSLFMSPQNKKKTPHQMSPTGSYGRSKNVSSQHASSKKKRKRKQTPNSRSLRMRAACPPYVSPRPSLRRSAGSKPCNCLRNTRKTSRDVSLNGPLKPIRSSPVYLKPSPLRGKRKRSSRRGRSRRGMTNYRLKISHHHHQPARRCSFR